MFIEIPPLGFHSVSVDSVIQNQSLYDIYYQEIELEPVIVNGYLTRGYILKPEQSFDFIKTGDDLCWIYNPSQGNTVRIEDGS